MHLSVRDPYIGKPNIFDQLPATIKFMAAIIVIIVAVSLPRSTLLGYGIIAAVLLGVLFFSKLPPWVIFKRLILFEPFVVIASTLSIIQPGGLRIFLFLILKGSLSLFTMVMLVASTRFSDLLGALIQLHVPRILVTNISLMYRYLFILIGEMECMLRARSSRSFTRQRWALWRSNAEVIGQLFVRASKRAERIYAAMCARGWKS